MCAIAKCRVGIDVETIREINNAEAFRPFLSDKEWLEIKSAKNKSKKLLQAFSLRESIIKADGRGFSLPENTIAKLGENTILNTIKWNIKQLNIKPDALTYLAYDFDFATISTKKYNLFS